MTDHETPPIADKAPLDVAVGRALRAAVAEHMNITETGGGFFDTGEGMLGAYHWCACGWRSDDGPWRDGQHHLRGAAQALIDHLSNAAFASVRGLIAAAQPEIEALREAIDAAHEEQRQALAAGRGEETMTLFQHWSATAGWLAYRIRQIERVGEADWPDAMRSTPVQPRSDGGDE